MQNRYEPNLKADWRTQMDAHNNWKKRITNQLEANRLSIPTIHQDHDELWKYNKSAQQIKQDNVLGIAIIASALLGIVGALLITNII